jgi:hypothetical protein
MIVSVLPGCYDACCGDGRGFGGGGGLWAERGSKYAIPPGAIPELTGEKTRRIREVQESLAEMDDFVIYENEWLYGGTQPGPYGKYHLAQILKRLPGVEFPVLIQICPDDATNEARRLLVSQYLQTNGILDADARVIIGYPEPGGLYGNEAIAAYRRGYEPRPGYAYGSQQFGGVGAYGGLGGGFGAVGSGFGAFGGGFGGLGR